MSEKAVLSNRIYFRPRDNTELKELIQKLTYKIEGRLNPKTKIRSVEIIKNYKLLSTGIISIPQGRMDLVPEGYIVEDKRVYNSVPFPTPKISLRESQQPIYDEVRDSCFVNAPVGWGKTFTALYLAKKLGQKTLVITHTTAIRDQWIEEVTELFGHTPGIIGSQKFDIEDHFIVIGNIQTVIKHVPRLSKEFGTVIVDEAHHTPASTFMSVLDGMYSRYRIGLSGTMIRTDGKHIIFKDFFGDTVYKPIQSNTLNPVVKLVPTGIHLTPGASWAEKINNLLYDNEYQQFISAVATTQIAKGHKVLVIADRKEFLHKIKDNLGSTCLLVTGDTSFEERKRGFEEIEKGEKVCIAGSRQIFSEGLSVNILSCVILAVPTSNPVILEQIIGRIMRLHPNKLAPEVYDMQFSGVSDRKQNNARLAFYASKGWEVLKI